MNNQGYKHFSQVARESHIETSRPHGDTEFRSEKGNKEVELADMGPMQEAELPEDLPPVEMSGLLTE